MHNYIGTYPNNFAILQEFESRLNLAGRENYQSIRNSDHSIETLSCKGDLTIFSLLICKAYYIILISNDLKRALNLNILNVLHKELLNPKEKTRVGEKRKQDKGVQRHALHCNRATLTNGSSFFCFLFFFFPQVHDLGRNLKSLLSWRCICLCRFSSASPSFAESSWQRNRKETSPSQISYNGQLHYNYLIFVSVLIHHCPTLLLLWAYFLNIFFLSHPPTSVFILTFKLSTLLYRPLNSWLLSYILSQKRKEEMSIAPERAVLSVFRIIMSSLSFLQSTVKVTSKLHSETTNKLLPIRADGILFDTFQIPVD